MEKEKLQQQLTTITKDVLEAANLKAGDTFVLGCTTSEIVGGTIGKNSSQEVGQWVIETLKSILDPKIYLAVQGCEHINRAVVVERELAEKKRLGNCFSQTRFTRRRFLFCGCF